MSFKDGPLAVRRHFHRDLTVATQENVCDGVEPIISNRSTYLQVGAARCVVDRRPTPTEKASGQTITGSSAGVRLVGVTHRSVQCDHRKGWAIVQDFHE